MFFFCLFVMGIDLDITELQVIQTAHGHQIVNLPPVSGLAPAKENI